MKPKRNELIICPKCHREYLPAEIFIPRYVFGTPKEIIRDVYGQILEYEGSTMDLQESYVCDSCNTTFTINAKVSFTTNLDTVGNFEDPYITTLKKTELF